MSHWKNQDDLEESRKLSREANRLQSEMGDKREEVKNEYQAKIDALNEKHFTLHEKYLRINFQNHIFYTTIRDHKTKNPPIQQNLK